MSVEVAKTFLEFLKLTPRYFIALGVIAAVLLFSSEENLKFIGVFDFAQDNRAILGLTLIGTVSLFIVFIAADGVFFIKGWWRKRDFIRRVTDRLNCLTEDEKQILRFYIEKRTRANVLRYDDGVVQGLVSSGIIYRSASLGDINGGFAYNISDFTWDYLTVHFHLLEGTTNTFRTDKREGSKLYSVNQSPFI
jgi:hypothetical protein